jgi:hypothetical protein
MSGRFETTAILNPDGTLNVSGHQLEAEAADALLPSPSEGELQRPVLHPIPVRITVVRSSLGSFAE